MALYLQAVTLLESMVTAPWKAGYCILTPSQAKVPLLLSPSVRASKQTGLMDHAECV